jgi:phosphatidylglycerol---prolipoprotein diacylglyceryl transferase
MHPEIFSFDTPGFLRGIFPDQMTVQGYGLMIALGILAAIFYAARQTSKLGFEFSKINDLFIWIFVAAFVGGRFFYFFERPDYYFGNPSNMLELSGAGFVFYGSLLFAIPTMIIYFKAKKMPVYQMLDIMAFVALIVHGFGRMGCFMAGCCHGVPTNSVVGVTFDHPATMASPIGTPLHPTQIYEILLLAFIFATLKVVQAKQSFQGQLFLLYIILYALGRPVIEIFRGDEGRGFIMDGLLSHSQLISIIIGIIAISLYFYILKNKRLKYKLSIRAVGGNKLKT